MRKQGKDLEAPNGASAAPLLCPCGAEMFWAECHMLDCEGGEYDEYEYDAINYSPGSYMTCSECGGKGGYWVCDDPERHSRTTAADGPKAPEGPQAVKSEQP